MFLYLITPKIFFISIISISFIHACHREYNRFDTYIDKLLWQQVCTFERMLLRKIMSLLQQVPINVSQIIILSEMDKLYYCQFYYFGKWYEFKVLLGMLYK